MYVPRERTSTGPERNSPERSPRESDGTGKMGIGWSRREGARGSIMILKRRVLLVEDHPMYRRGLRRLLEETGRYEVVAEAQSGHEAIHFADVYRPELIILDVQLPGITGLKVARILRKQQQNAKLVFLSM